MTKVEYLKECITLHTAMVNTGLAVKAKLTKKDKESLELMMKILDKGTDDPNCNDNQFDKYNELAKEFDKIGEGDTGKNDPPVNDPPVNDPPANDPPVSNSNTTSTEPKKTRKTKVPKPDGDPKEKAILDLFSKVPKKEISNLKSSTMLTLLELQKG